MFRTLEDFQRVKALTYGVGQPGWHGCGGEEDILRSELGWVDLEAAVG